MAGRRLVSAAVAGTLAVLGLTACRPEPGTAAYVGDTRITNATVEKIFDEFPADARQKSAAAIRREIVSELVIAELGTQIAANNSDVKIPPPDPGSLTAAAGEAHVPAGGAYVTTLARALAAYQALQPLGAPVAPTDNDLHEVFAQVVANGFAKAGDFDALRSQLDTPDLRNALGVRGYFANATVKYHVLISPQYQPLELTFTVDLNAAGEALDPTAPQVKVVVLIPLAPTATDSAVTDVSSPAP